MKDRFYTYKIFQWSCIDIIRTPLHCAASCNDVKICEFLIENGASVFASSFDDLELPSDKCDEKEEGFRETCDYLLSKQLIINLTKRKLFS